MLCYVKHMDIYEYHRLVCTSYVAWDLNLQPCSADRHLQTALWSLAYNFNTFDSSIAKFNVNNGQLILIGLLCYVLYISTPFILNKCYLKYYWSLFLFVVTRVLDSKKQWEISKKCFLLLYM